MLPVSLGEYLSPAAVLTQLLLGCPGQQVLSSVSAVGTSCLFHQPGEYGTRHSLPPSCFRRQEAKVWETRLWLGPDQALGASPAREPPACHQIQVLLCRNLYDLAQDLAPGCSLLKFCRAGQLGSLCPQQAHPALLPHLTIP